MGVLATLLPDPVWIRRLRSAVRDRHTIVECASWADLQETCGQEPVQLAIIDLYSDGGSAEFPPLRTLRRTFPGVAVILYVAPRPERLRDLFDAGRLGVDALALADQDDSPRSLLLLVEQAEGRSLAGLVQRSLGGVDDVSRDAVMLAVTRAHERLTPARLADILRVSRRLLSQRLSDCGLPAPHRLINWGRLIVAAHMLEDGHRPADRVALALSFPSGSAFRNTCQRYLHASPNEIRRRGGAAYVVRALQQQMRPADSERDLAAPASGRIRALRLAV